MNFFYDSTIQAINIADNYYPTGTVSLIFKDNDLSVEAVDLGTHIEIMSKNLITNLEDENGVSYTDKADFLAKISPDFFLKASGGGGVPTAAIVVTYSELQTLISTNSLLLGVWYLLTDYVTVYNQSYTDAVKQGVVEPLLLLAIATNEISKTVGYSLTNRDDVIKYSVDDNTCRDGVTSRKGIITYRKSIKANVECDFDFRVVAHNIKAMDIAESWVSGSNYFGDVLLKYNGRFYITTNGVNNSTISPNLDKYNFYDMQINVGDYVNFGDKIIGYAKDFTYTVNTSTASKDYNTFPDYNGNDEDFGLYYKNISILGGKINGHYSSDNVIKIDGSKFTQPKVDDLIIRNSNTVYIRSTNLKSVEIRNCEQLDLNGASNRLQLAKIYNSVKINSGYIENSTIALGLGFAVGTVTNSDIAEFIGTAINIEGTTIKSQLFGNFGTLSKCTLNTLQGHFQGYFWNIVSHGGIANFDINSATSIQNAEFKGDINFWGTDMTGATVIFDPRQKEIYKNGSTIQDIVLSMWNENELQIFDVDE